MDHQIKYTVIRSGRRTLGLQVKKDGEIIVKLFNVGVSRVIEI